MHSMSLSSLNALWGRMVDNNQFNTFNIPKIRVHGRNAIKAPFLGNMPNRLHKC